MSRHLPGRPKLKRSDEKRIVRILSGVQRTAPEIVITPYTGETFEVYRDEAGGYAQPAVGREGFYADYDGETGRFMEATHKKVTRRLKARGMWCYEIFDIGGTFFDDRFTLCWYIPGYHRVNEAHTYAFNNVYVSPRVPRHLAMRNEIRWTDESAAQGPDEALALVAGFCNVRVGGREFECVQTLWVEPDEVDLEEDVEKGLPKWSRLWIAYVSREGRTVLDRSFCTLTYYQKKILEWHEDSEWPGNRARVTYNGVDFYHWFDTLTDVALGWPDLKRNHD